MGFSAKIKEDVMVACARRCCLCEQLKGPKMEVHHVRPRAKGGTDSFENAIPLCFDCHQDMGYDSTHPKGTKYSEGELKRRRDKFYKKIQDGSQTAPRNTSRFSDHDKQLLREMNMKFDMNYLNSLKNESFGKLVKRSVVEIIHSHPIGVRKFT